ncbi:MAG: YtxH domain-containing protein [Chloroflexi bacterium]|nr:YtxH domain-containing protein [Chloroflexota bacterium]MCL5275792.1 YtxH domain-containing protein [Chloroflexota bacterium]
MNKIFSFMCGAIFGAIVGAAAILVSTPKSGESIRADIRREVKIILEEGRRASAARRAELESQLSQMRGDVSEEEGSSE